MLVKQHILNNIGHKKGQLIVFLVGKIWNEQNAVSDCRNECVSKRPHLQQGNMLDGEIALPLIRKSVLDSTSCMSPLPQSVFLTSLQKLCKHQLSSVYLGVPFWLAVK
jgi:hypothetical protein